MQNRRVRNKERSRVGLRSVVLSVLVPPELLQTVVGLPADEVEATTLRGITRAHSRHWIAEIQSPLV